MAKVLVAYGTTEGHTAKIAHFVADVGRQAGHDVRVVHAATRGPEASPGSFDAVIAGGSVHQGRHQEYLYDWIRLHRARIERMPSAFFQASLTAVVRDEEHDREARAVLETLTRETGWTPTRVGHFAGALLYSQYDWMKRFLVKMLARHEGADTDASKDHEYTDWNEVRRWAEAFFSSLPRTVPLSPASR